LVGVDGDMYIDETTGQVSGPKGTAGGAAAGAWNAVSPFPTPVVVPAGAPAPSGVAGQVLTWVASGGGVPAHPAYAAAGVPSVTLTAVTGETADAPGATVIPPPVEGDWFINRLDRLGWVFANTAWRQVIYPMVAAAPPEIALLITYVAELEARIRDLEDNAVRYINYATTLATARPVPMPRRTYAELVAGTAAFAPAKVPMVVWEGTTGHPTNADTVDLTIRPDEVVG
jgi:hypothetical protein